MLDAIRDTLTQPGDTEPVRDLPRLDADTDTIGQIISNARRRHVIQYVDQHGTSTLGDIAEHVASIENEKPPRHLTTQERKRVYVALYQAHCETLDDADAIQWDGDRKTLAPGRDLAGYVALVDVLEQSGGDRHE